MLLEYSYAKERSVPPGDVLLAAVDPRIVCRLVVGRRQPSLGTVQALCTAVGLPPAEAIMCRERREEEGTGGGQHPRNRL